MKGFAVCIPILLVSAVLAEPVCPSTPKCCGNCQCQASQEHQDCVPAKRNWKQCVWKALNDGKDSGKIMECQFEKKSSETSLRVTYAGDIRGLTSLTQVVCNRWFITVNGGECASPASIEAVIHSNIPHDNHHRPAYIDGFCDGIPRGIVTVALATGACKAWSGGVTPGDGYTCWNSNCRLIIEEIEKSQ